MNYELIYQVRKAGLDTTHEGNRIVRARNRAEDAEREKIKNDRDSLAKILGHTRFEISSVSCLADGISCHIYSWPGLEPPNGLGKKKCVFCGCDDFDD